ncbi:MAG TPA: hypothetical protein VIF43_04400 [Patescibacteria group bacterium]|jgi:hypothetical protein
MDTNKTAYVASRVREADRAKALAKGLADIGYRTILDWTSYEPKKPYRENRTANREFSIQAVEAARDADVFVLLDAPGMVGAYIETGVAIAETLRNPKKRVFVAGEPMRDSVFFSLPSVEYVDSTEEIVEALTPQKAAV